MRVLYISAGETEPGFAQAISTESGRKVYLHEVAGAENGSRALREGNYDVILVQHVLAGQNALEIVRGLLVAGVQVPILVLGTRPAIEMFIPCCELGAEDYVNVRDTTVRDLLWLIFRAARRGECRRENERMRQENRLRIQREQEEAATSLAEETRVIRELASFARTQPTSDPQHAQLLVDVTKHYTQLVKAFVMTDAGGLAAEIHDFGGKLASVGVTPVDFALMHSRVMEDMLHHLGAKSCRHLMRRGDLLRLAVMIRLTDCS